MTYMVSQQINGSWQKVGKVHFNKSGSVKRSSGNVKPGSVYYAWARSANKYFASSPMAKAGSVNFMSFSHGSISCRINPC